ncbi:uncharacterized protein LOC144621833 isoform X2 [Crassostrea virginica]
MFKEGCPNATFNSDQMYKFPACFEIEPSGRCYKAETSCQPKTRLLTVLLDTTTSTIANDTSDSRTADTKDRNSYPFVIILPTIILIILLSISAFIAWKKKWRMRCRGSKENIQTEESIDLLEVDYREKIEEDINKLGIEYILQQLHREKKILPFIATKLRIPQEILYWNLDDRDKFVKCMNVGKISVFNARGMVIGCARAGKTTLVKKLKGETDLNTESTTGIEIHTHVFKLNADESTIHACVEKDKNKGCLCLTPRTLELSVENRGKNKRKEEPKNPHESMSSKQTSQTGPNEGQIVLARSTGVQSNMTDNSDATYHEDTESKSTVSSKDTSNTEECNAKIDFSDCIASVNENNLKMLSLLDFAGHSAYYACHHLFFSPRAFFILVIDMTKPLENNAIDSCIKEDLIYSNWTYADYIRYWLGSIHTYSSKEAPIILVATHAESNRADPKKALDFFFEICKCLPEKLRNRLDRSRLFSTEKNSNKNMDNLKKCIASTVKSLNHWGEEVPISWSKLESMFKKLREYRKIYLLSDLLGDVQNMKDLRIENEKDLIIALTFFHETGVIVFSKEVKTFIILDVQWFVDAFKCIILEEEHINIKDQFNFPEFNDLTEFGLLSNKLLNELWKDSSFYQHKESLVTYMKQLDMIAELTKEMWFVPCMNKQRYQCSVLENCNVSSRLCFLYEFLPFVIYHRLIVACVNNLGMKPWKIEGKPCIFHTVTILCSKDPIHRVLIGICENKERTHREYPYSIEIQINVTKQGKKIDTRWTSKFKKDICQILTVLTQVFSSCERSFHVGYRCRLEPFGGNLEGHIIKEEEIPSLELVCSKCSPSHYVDKRSILCYWEEIADNKQFNSEENEKEVSNLKTEEKNKIPQGEDDEFKTELKGQVQHEEGTEILSVKEDETSKTVSEISGSLLPSLPEEAKTELISEITSTNAFIDDLPSTDNSEELSNLKTEEKNKIPQGEDDEFKTELKGQVQHEEGTEILSVKEDERSKTVSEFSGSLLPSLSEEAKTEQVSETTSTYSSIDDLPSSDYAEGQPEQHDEEQKALFDNLLLKLKKEITPDMIKKIKSRLNDRTEQYFKRTENTEDLLSYLFTKLATVNNVLFIQGLFLASNAPKLYKICLQYAETRKHEVLFFEKKTLDTDPAKYIYRVNIPNSSSYLRSDLEQLQKTVAVFVNAQFDDVLFTEVK